MFMFESYHPERLVIHEQEISYRENIRGNVPIFLCIEISGVMDKSLFF